MNDKPDFMILCSKPLQDALNESAREIAELNDIERMEIILDIFEEKKPNAQVLSLVYFLINVGDKALLHSHIRDITDVTIN